MVIHQFACCVLLLFWYLVRYGKAATTWGSSSTEWLCNETQQLRPYRSLVLLPMRAIHNLQYALLFRAYGQRNEVYGGAEKSVGIFLHRSGDDAVVKGDKLSYSRQMSHNATIPVTVSPEVFVYKLRWKGVQHYTLPSIMLQIDNMFVVRSTTELFVVRFALPSKCKVVVDYTYLL